MSASASGRLAWAASVVAAQPGERILEVGCGHGVLVDLMAASGASVLGVDRSPTMTTTAARRNARAVADGRVRLRTGSLVQVPLDGRFDAVACFDVRAFWTPPAPEWDAVVGVLAPAGRVVVAFSDMDGDGGDRVVESVRRLAAARGLVVHTVHRASPGRYASVAVELRRAHPSG